MQDHGNECLQGTKKQQEVVWDEVNQRCLNTKFYITFTKNKEIKYISDDGSILRIYYKKFRINKISEMITSIFFFKKVFKSNAIWKGEILKGVGGQYSNDGKKHGQWQDLSENYWEYVYIYLLFIKIRAQIQEVGEYLNNQKKGIWKYIYKYRVICGDSYEQGFKNRQWTDLDEGFKDYLIVQVKIFWWWILQNIRFLKWNLWIEFSNGFSSSSQIYHKGENQNGKNRSLVFLLQRKQSKSFSENWWRFLLRRCEKCKWVELSNGFYCSSQVLHKGEYKNGRKIGVWDIDFKQWNKKLWELIGGGAQDNQGLKHEKWIYFNDSFKEENQVTYHCLYKNGQIIGRYDINYRQNQNKLWEQIGGGSYEQGQKNGLWVILIGVRSYIRMNINMTKKLVNGILITNIIMINLENKCYEIIFQYIVKEVFMKMDQKMVDEIIVKSLLVVNILMVKKLGNKILFQIVDQICNQIINLLQQSGGGSYDQFFQKNGLWIDLSDGFKSSNQVVCNGVYKNGKKIGS
ncbi:unnamed protein product [Paramecium pentaurelia]|uniref:Uncharacterized protein n=1 Tax=Paramecium pentaurelia TaxID=43138 RepID=A0A8S1WX48_9CILI|nr:unnamed protein product [Paramecium pentaurelia]